VTKQDLIGEPDQESVPLAEGHELGREFPLGLIIGGALCGAFVGYLLGPTLPFGGGHLPLSTVLTAGSNLRGLDALLASAAQEAFNILLVSAIVGALGGFALGRLQARGPRSARSSSNSPELTVISPGLAIVTPKPESEPPCIERGQTMADVQAILLEQPKTIVKLEGKEIHLYSAMKVIFMDGRVADVQL
jgi:hypothetical protein